MQVDGGGRLQSPATERVRPGASAYAATTPSTSADYRQALVSLEKFGRDRTATVLIEGESGTGKTILARRLHELSPRRQAPFRACVLSALDDALASDELFGHVAGAFTGARESRAGLFASAAGGTVFLDEIGKASLTVQQKLLHVIEYHEIAPLGADRVVPVDVRVVAASNLPLEQLVRDGTFLPDLYARLKCFRIVLPPLRARAQDIPQLVLQCLTRHARECGYLSAPTIDDALMAALTNAPWPDNLRELDGTIHRLLVEADGADVLTTALCVGDLAHLVAAASPKAPLEITVVRRALAESDNKKARAARLLGVSRSTVHRVLRDAEMRPDC
jgi:two-component system response regulator HydG